VSTNEAKAAAAIKNRVRITFEATKLDAAQKNIHVFAGIASVGNLLFLFCDLIFIPGQTDRMVVAIARYCFSILLILLIRKLQRIRTFAAFAALVTVLEAAEMLLYLFVLWLYESPDFMIQSLGLIMMILVAFIVPNRSENMLALSLIGSAAYFLFFYYTHTIPAKEYLATMAYAILTIVICSVKAIGGDRYALREFQAKSRLEETSAKDFLTNAATRERLEEEARRWMSFCRRQSLPLCMVFVDVDNLKHIHDCYGHAMGDIALKNIAKIMQNQLRNSDTIARWGGDEFVLLLPNVTLQNAVLLLDRVKMAISRLVLDDGVTVSCSFGVVQMGQENTYAQMLSEADALMYRSKQGGKGRISYLVEESGEEC
jgi:diguanylate cyclase (GGDEF)-like protein